MTERHRTVLVPTDFSDGSRRALDRAVRLPLARSARIILLHVAPELPPELAAEADRRVRELLAEEAARVSPPSGVELGWELATGKAYRQIISCARARDASLVVLGRHGRRTIRDRFVGTTADRLIRYGERPVLVVNGESARAYRRPLIAVEVGEAAGSTARAVVEAALGVVGPEVEQLDLLHAYRVPFEGLQYMVRSPDVDRGLEQDARRALAELAELVTAAGVPHAVHVRRGDARTVILTEVLAHAADLVVLGTHGRSGIANVVVGSVAEWVVAAAPCDVLIARPPQFRFEMP